MVINVVYFQRNLHLKGKSQVSVIDTFVLEKFRSAFFILLSELGCTAC